MHLAQFLVHGPTYHSLAMWRHPETAAAGYDWSRPALYQHIARVCERGLFDMVFFADLNYISDTYRHSLEPRCATPPRRRSMTRSRCSPTWRRRRAISAWPRPSRSASTIRSMPRGCGRRSTI
jgi:hypothetical protein